MHLNIQKAQVPVRIRYDFPQFENVNVDTAFSEIKLLHSIVQDTMTKFKIPALRDSSGFIVGWFELDSVKGLFGPKIEDIEAELTDFLKPWNITYYSVNLIEYLKLAHAGWPKWNKNENTVYLVVVFKPKYKLVLLIPEKEIESAIERI
jgi:hypothetical protein